MFLLAYLCPSAHSAHIVPGVIAGVAALILIALQTRLTEWWNIPPFIHINLSIVMSTLLIFFIGLTLARMPIRRSNS